MANPLPLVAYPDLAQRVEALKRDGFVYLPGVLTTDEISALRNSMDRLDALPESYDRHQTPEEGGFLNKSMINRTLFVIVLTVSFLLTFIGCFEMVKRTEPPPWEREQPQRTKPQEKSPPSVTQQPQPDSVTIAHRHEIPKIEPPPPPRPSSPSSRPTIGRPPEEINHYALWCIRHGMWKEAKTHLEKAAAIDSTTASLQNNLGLIYEYLNLDEKAQVAYQKATALNPDNDTYRENYRRFKRAISTERRMRDEVKTPPDTIKAVTDTVVSPIK